MVVPQRIDNFNFEKLRVGCPDRKIFGSKNYCIPYRYEGGDVLIRIDGRFKLLNRGGKHCFMITVDKCNKRVGPSGGKVDIRVEEILVTEIDLDKSYFKAYDAFDSEFDVCIDRDRKCGCEDSDCYCKDCDEDIDTNEEAKI